MNGFCWWLTGIASGALEPNERDAVLGDFTESGEAGGQALCGILSLIARRQAELWKDWRPWLILASLVIPLAWLLSIAARLTAGSSAVYLWSYLNNWDWALLRYATFWYILRDAAIAVSTQCAILICWSWSAGFLLGSVSRRLVPSNCLLFCLISLLGEVLVASRYLQNWFFHPFAQQSDPVSALMAYRELFPVLVLLALVLIPIAWAMRGARLKQLPKPVRIILLIAGIFTIIGMVIQQPGLGFFVKAHGRLGFLSGWPREFLHFVVYWPVAYLLAGTIVHRWQRTATHESLIRNTGDS